VRLSVIPLTECITSAVNLKTATHASTPIEASVCGMWNKYHTFVWESLYGNVFTELLPMGLISYLFRIYEACPPCLRRSSIQSQSRKHLPHQIHPIITPRLILEILEILSTVPLY
jgi:hypothetical protein